MTKKDDEFLSKATSEIPFMEIEGLDHPVRVMTREHIRERDNLNVENTATAMRRRVVAEQNGHLDDNTPRKDR